MTVASVLVLLAIPPSYAVVSDIKVSVINTQITECLPTNITWTGGTPPYTFGLALDFSDFSNGPLEQFNNISSSFFVWSTDVSSDHYVQFAVEDAQTINGSEPYYRLLFGT